MQSSFRDTNVQLSRYFRSKPILYIGFSYKFRAYLLLVDKIIEATVSHLLQGDGTVVISHLFSNDDGSNDKLCTVPSAI